MARIVDGKQRTGFDIEREEVTDGVAVFGAIEAMRAGASRIGVRGCRLIERGFQRFGEGRGGGFGWTWESGWGHLAAADFAKDALPDVGTVAGLRGVER